MRLILLAAIPLAYLAGLTNANPESNESISDKAVYRMQEAILKSFKRGQESIILQAIETKDGWEIASK